MSCARVGLCWKYPELSYLPNLVVTFEGAGACGCITASFAKLSKAIGFLPTHRENFSYNLNMFRDPGKPIY